MRHIQRKLSAEEIGMWMGAQVTPINFILTANIQGTFTIEALRTALNKAREKHPLLAVRIEKNEQGELVFSTQNVPDFSIRVIARGNQSDWHREVETELTKKFDLATGPLIRFVWLHSTDCQELLIICHHGVADGLAAAYMLHDIMTFLGDPQIPIDPLPLMPGCLELIPDFSGKAAIERQARLKSTLYKLALPLQRITRKQQSPPRKNAYHLLAWELSPQMTKALVNHCRAAQTSVHAALCCAFLRAFGELRQAGWQRIIQSPVNLRQRLTQPVGQAFGCFIGLTEFSVNCHPDLDFWQVARAIKSSFNRHTTDEHIFPQIVEMGVIMERLGTRLSPENIGDAWMQTNYDLSITNLGRLDFPQMYGTLKLDTISGPSVSGNPKEIVLGAVTLRDQLRFTLIFTNLKLKISQAEEIKDSAMRQLAEVVA